MSAVGDARKRLAERDATSLSKGHDTESLADCEGWTCQSCGADNFIPAGFARIVQARALRERIATAEPTWHRGMYGCPDDMFSRRDLMALLAETDGRP